VRGVPTTTLPLTPSTLGACCAPVTGGVIDEATAERLARVFKALGDPTRVRLVSLIAAAEGGQACICDLTEPVGLSQPTVSHHMKLLTDAGLISREQRGKWAYFRVVDEALAAVEQGVADRLLRRHRWVLGHDSSCRSWRARNAVILVRRSLSPGHQQRR
jgi:ArsR family transcriptional regulator